MEERSYFTLEELLHSDTAERRHIDNSLDHDCLPNINKLMELLNKLRSCYGKPIKVNSGYRSPILNKAVGGARNSDHTRGCAADIVGTPNTKQENAYLFNILKSNLDRWGINQLIDEKGMSWVHVSIAPDGVKPKKQVLKL